MILFETQGYVEMPADELETYVATQDPDAIATKDYVASDTGEIVWERGQRAGDTRYHPEARLRDEEQRRKKNAEWEREQLMWDPEYQLNHAINEFVKNFGVDHDMSVPAEDAAPDMAEGFFMDYPNWKDWADDLDLKKWNVKEMVAERIYSRLLGEE